MDIVPSAKIDSPTNFVDNFSLDIENLKIPGSWNFLGQGGLISVSLFS